MASRDDNYDGFDTALSLVDDARSDEQVTPLDELNFFLLWALWSGQVEFDAEELP